MSITEILPGYDDSIEGYQRRIDDLRQKRIRAMKKYDWVKADELGNRIVVLEDSIKQQQNMIHEIERHK